MNEKKKENIFKKIEKNILLQVAFFVVSMTVIVGGYVLVSGRIQQINERKRIAEEQRKEEKRISEMKVSEDTNILIGFDDVINTEKGLRLSGWVLRLNSATNHVNLLLKEVNGTGEVILKAASSERDEVEEYFNPEWDFGQVGFSVDVDREKIKADTCYEVFVNVDYEVDGAPASKKISSAQYLYQGELYRYNPKTFVAPDITDEEIVRVMENGTLRIYDSKAKIWIYECEGVLYFITNPEFGSMKENKIGVPIMPNTTRRELLPENRIQHGFDHLGFYFEDEAYMRVGITPYQIVTMSLPTAYPITTISIGLYNNVDKVWLCNIALPMADWSFNTYLKER